MNKHEISKHIRIIKVEDGYLYGVYGYSAVKLNEQQVDYFLQYFRKKLKLKEQIQLRKELEVTTDLTYKEIMKMEAI